MMECPIATQDSKVNDRNKAEAESKAKYAEAGDEEYSCGNCSRFIQTPEMIDCMISGMPEDMQEIVDDDDIGYCARWDFRCSEDYVCDRWLAGGPVKGMTEGHKVMLKMAKLLEEDD
jgi:hypothetical protein